MKRLLSSLSLLALLIACANGLAGCANGLAGSADGGGAQAGGEPWPGGPPSAGRPPAEPPPGVAPRPGPETSLAPPCPESGVWLALGTGDAAMGLRVQGLRLINCGRKTYRIQGYPSLRPLDDDKAELDVRVLHGAHDITISLPHLDGPPKPVTLKPGEQAAAAIIWRNTYDDTTNLPVTVPYLEVAPAAGEPAQTLTVDAPLDLGSTGKIGVSPWEPAEAGPAAGAPDPGVVEQPSATVEPEPVLPLL